MPSLVGGCRRRVVEFSAAALRLATIENVGPWLAHVHCLQPYVREGGADYLVSLPPQVAALARRKAAGLVHGRRNPDDAVQQPCPFFEFFEYGLLPLAVAACLSALLAMYTPSFYCVTLQVG